MKITQNEEVTRTYCDVCGTEVTRANNTGNYDEANPLDDYTVCMKTKFNLKLRSRPELRLDCEQLAVFYMEHPDLANFRFKERNSNTPEFRRRNGLE